MNRTMLTRSFTIAIAALLLSTSLSLAAQPAQKPTLADVAYGDHPKQVLDFWKAESEEPSPLLFYIHGGG
jgi:carboxylesterase type B